jgi:hypothetical protein
MSQYDEEVVLVPKRKFPYRKYQQLNRISQKDSSPIYGTGTRRAKVSKRGGQNLEPR